MQIEKTLEEVAKEYAKQYALSTRHISHIGFEDGAKWQAERMYTEKQMINYGRFCVECEKQGFIIPKNIIKCK